MRVWRVARAAYAKSGAQAFDGTGGLYGSGRWHSRGRRIVYTASSESLAKLETLVHFSPLLAPRLVLIEATIPDSAIAALSGPLPPAWDAIPETEASRQIGDEWLASASSLALEVPSVHSKNETNVLINPLHPAAARIEIGPPIPFSFDQRLVDPRKRR